MGVAQHGAPDMQRPGARRGCLLALAGALGGAGKILEHAGDLVVVRPQHALIDRQRARSVSAASR